MQISRHWRLNTLRYRLQGVRDSNGELSIQERPYVRSAQPTMIADDSEHSEDARVKALTTAA